MGFPDPFRAHRKHGGRHRFNLDMLAWSQAQEERRRRRQKPNRRKDLDDGGVPVEPDKPRNLSGGAAAALEFDDEAGPGA